MIRSLTSFASRIMAGFCPAPGGGTSWRRKGRRGKRSGGSLPRLSASVLCLSSRLSVSDHGPLQPVLQGPSSPWLQGHYPPFFLPFSGADGFSLLLASGCLTNSSSINEHVIQVSSLNIWVSSQRSIQLAWGKAPAAIYLLITLDDFIV